MLEYKGHREPLVRKVRPVLKALPALRGRLVHREQQALRALLAHKVQLGLRAHRERKALRVLLVFRQLAQLLCGQALLVHHCLLDGSSVMELLIAQQLILLFMQ